jgi:hypothetical protein
MVEEEVHPRRPEARELEVQNKLGIVRENPQ